MPARTIPVTFLIWLSGLFLLTAQPVSFTHYTVREGLSQSEILCIYQDREGFLWIGTQNGLNKFDGYQFETYYNIGGDEKSISNNWIFTIAEDPQGNLLLGTKGGLNRFDKASGEFSLVNYRKQDSEINDRFVYGVAADSLNIYINTPPFLSVVNNQGNISTYDFGFEYSGMLHDVGYPVIAAGSGRIWAGTHDGLYCLEMNSGNIRSFTEDSSPSEKINHNHVTALYEDKRGRIWTGTESGLNCYDPLRDSMYSFLNTETGEWSSNFVRAILIDRENHLWVGTEGGGLYKIALDKEGFPGEITVFRSGRDRPFMLGHDIVYSLLYDRSENLWIGTIAGLDKIDLKKKFIRKYSKSDDPSSVDLLDNVIASVYEDSARQLWIGTWGKGLNILNRESGEVIHYTAGNQEVPEDHVHVIFEDHASRIWIGTRSGISVFDPHDKRFIPVHTWFNSRSFDRFDDVRVYSIMEDDKRNIWVSTGNGISVLDIKRGEVTEFNAGSPEPHFIGSNLVYSLLQDSYGDIWIATSAGLDRFNPENNRMIHYRADLTSENAINDNFIIALCEDDSANIWISNSQGLNCFHRKDSVFSHYSVNDGLPSNIIYNIIKDKKGRLWFSTGNGVAWTNPYDEIKQFSIVEDLEGMEFNLKAVNQNDEGELFFGGMDGLISFYPDSLQKNSYIPPVFITRFEKEREGQRQEMNVYRNEIDLSYQDYSFTIEFAALDFTDPSKNRYAYRLSGVHEKWVDNGTRNYVHFTNLPPGNYVFDVKGTNDDRVWNNEGTTLRIRIHPPWWKSDLAYVIYGILLIAGIIMLIKLRERNLVNEKRKLEEKVRIRTAEIALQKKQTEESEEKLRSTINSIDDLVFVLDNEGVFREFYNPGQQEIHYRDPYRYLSKHFTETGLPGNIISRLEEVFGKMKGTTEVQEFDYFFGKDENRQFYNAKASPRISSSGELTGVVIVSRNITFRKRAEQMLEKQKEELRELNVTKDRFFSILAHDLKNPFTNLYSLSDLLYRNYDSLDEEDKKNGLRNINKSAEFIYNLLENLLTWSRSQRGKINFNPGNFVLNNIINVNLNLYRPTADKKGLVLESRVEENLKVFGDREMTDTIIRNLLSNAVKFTARGGKITIDAKRRNSEVTVQVADEGTGIPPADIPKLFQVDEKYKTKGTEGETGTGLGLVLCKEFAEKNGGTIWCESEEGKGSVFRFTIPAG